MRIDSSRLPDIENMEVSARQQLIVRVRLTMTMECGKCSTCRGQGIHSGAEEEGPYTLGGYFRKFWRLVSRRRTSRGAFQAKRRAGVKGVVYEELQLAPPGRRQEGAGGYREEVAETDKGKLLKRGECQTKEAGFAL